MNCPYCNTIIIKNSNGSIYSDHNDHIFIYYKPTEWWLIIRQKMVDFRFEVYEDIPPTMYVFPINAQVSTFTMEVPFNMESIKEVADKYVQHYWKLKAFT
jgi:hypothetical protein